MQLRALLLGEKGRCLAEGIPQRLLVPLVGIVNKSIDHIIHSGLEYEFRTTAVAEFHNPEDFTVIAEMIEGADVYYIQKFKDSGDLITEGLHPLGDEDMRKCAENARKVLNNVSLRGV